MKWKKEIINSFIVLKQEYYIDADTGEEKLQEKKMTNAIIENKNAIIKCVKKNANGYTMGAIPKSDHVCPGSQSHLLSLSDTK